MAIRHATPLHFSPYGASDAVDATNVHDGPMAMLTNLVPDPSTTNLWQCRPASIKLTNFPTFTTPGFMSALIVLGNVAYGLIGSGRNPGNDEPFAYNLLTQSFVTVTGITVANTPGSPATSGAWVPPTVALVGTKLIFTHPGFNFAGGFAFGILDISNAAAPTWTATNTTVNALPALPTAVAQFGGRAYYFVNPVTGQPGAYFSDILVPGTITNATQIITFDDNAQLTAAAGLGLFNQLGGVVQSLMVFKGSQNIYQITGDFALGTLAKNSLNVATGTNSPLSVTPTPKGLAFLAPDGLRMIDFDAKITDPIGVDGEGINAPFVYSLVPSRVQASSNQNVLRVSVQNALAIGSPNQEWWYDISRHKWSGPHTFPASMIAPWNNTFIMAPVGVTGALFQSDVAQSNTSTFVENGVQMSWTFTTCLLPDAQQMSEMCLSEATINMALVSGQTPVSVQALDQNGSVLNSVLLNSGGAGTLWGQFNWGQSLWGGAANALSHRPLNWTQPVVFSRLQISATGNAIGNFKVGDLFLRYQKLGYLQRYAGNTA